MSYLYTKLRVMLIETDNRAERAVEVMLLSTLLRCSMTTDVGQAEKAVKVMLSVTDRGGAAASDFRHGLQRSNTITSKLSAFQTAAGACVAATERHSDGGAQILADTAGLTRNDTRERVKLEHQPGQPMLGTFHETSTSIRKV